MEETICLTEPIFWSRCFPLVAPLIRGTRLLYNLRDIKVDRQNELFLVKKTISEKNIKKKKNAGDYLYSKKLVSQSYVSP